MLLDNNNSMQFLQQIKQSSFKLVCKPSWQWHESRHESQCRWTDRLFVPRSQSSNSM